MGLFPSDAIVWTARIVGIVIFLQTLELLALRRAFGSQGIWRWKVIRRDYLEFSGVFCRTLDRVLEYRSFLLVLLLRLACSAWIVFQPNPFSLTFILFSTVLISLRWRGSFNGGSDFMNLIVISALTAASFYPESLRVQIACLWYIAIQTCTSYFLAGAIKLRRANWRSGRALTGFLQHAIYEPAGASLLLIRSRSMSQLASWIVIGFECAFPLALLDMRICVAMLAWGFLFHLGNVYFFGLNRFLLSWITAYPALIFCSQFKAGL